MGQEIREILNMIGEGKITPEEGERLINALKEGEAREKASSRSSGRPGGSHDFDWMMDRYGEELERKVEDWAEGLGRNLEDFFNQSSFPFGRWDSPSREDAPPSFRFPEEELPGWGYDSRMSGTSLFPEEGRLDTEGVTGLILSSPSGADLKLVPSEDRFCRLSPSHGLRAVRKGSWLVLEPEDDCEIALPRTLEKIAVALVRGDLEAEGIPGELWVKSLSGDIRLTGLERTFWIASLRGDSTLNLSPRFAGRGSVNSLKGDIDCRISSALNMEFTARTIRGSLSAEGSGLTVKGQFRKPGNVFLTGAVGEGGKDFLDLNTTGGDITIGTVLDA